MSAAATPEMIMAFMIQLEDEAQKIAACAEWQFTDGESFFHCTASARRVAEKFGGRVVGFFSEDNPKAEIALGHDGHDFAIISERFIVDFWASYVTGILGRAIFDLSAPADRAIISCLYGAAEAWQGVGPISVYPNS